MFTLECQCLCKYSKKLRIEMLWNFTLSHTHIKITFESYLIIESVVYSHVSLRNTATQSTFISECLYIHILCFVSE